MGYVRPGQTAWDPGTGSCRKEERRYAQERVDGGYRARFAGTAANRVRGIAKLEHDLDRGRGFWQRNPEHGFVVIKFRVGHVLHVAVIRAGGERQGDALDLGS